MSAVDLAGALLAEVRAALAGSVVAWTHERWGCDHHDRPWVVLMLAVEACPYVEVQVRETSIGHSCSVELDDGDVTVSADAPSVSALPATMRRLRVALNAYREAT